jgi:hypothetical protein
LFNIVSCELSNSLGLQFSGLDILALLVSIYGSSDLFIVEYRSLLAEKLLANLKYLTEQEVANLELLKIRSNSTLFSLLIYINVCMYVFRFGEESLHSCEVMLKDIEDSKRINNAIQSKVRVVFWYIHTLFMYVSLYVCIFLLSLSQASSGSNSIDVDFAIVSENYWPAIQQEALTYHPDITNVRMYYDCI